MVFSANDSPLAGRSGKAVTGRAIGTRLMQEAESSVSLRVTPLPGGTERYEVQVGFLKGGEGGICVGCWVSALPPHFSQQQCFGGGAWLLG